MGVFDVTDRGISQAVSRRLGMLPIGQSLTGDIGVAFELSAHAEMQWHLGWRRWCSSNFTGTPAAGQVIRGQLRNPDAPQRLIVVVEDLIFLPGSAADAWSIGVIGIGPGIADLPNIITAQSPLDGLNVPVGAPSRAAAILSTNSGAAITLTRGTGQTLHEFTPIISSGTSSNDLYAITRNLPVVLRPGNAIFWEGSTPAAPYIFTIRWRERMANDQESAP